MIPIGGLGEHGPFIAGRCDFGRSARRQRPARRACARVAERDCAVAERVRGIAARGQKLSARARAETGLYSTTSGVFLWRVR